MLGKIKALEAIHDQCLAHRPLSPDLNAWLAQALAQYLDHRCDNLNDAFGLTQGHGGVPWWRERAIRQRDAALRDLAEAHFSELSTYARAKAVAQVSARYGAICWPRDEALDEMPCRYRGTHKEQLWRAFRSGAKMPVSERRLRTLLG